MPNHLGTSLDYYIIISNMKNLSQLINQQSMECNAAKIKQPIFLLSGPLSFPGSYESLFINKREGLTEERMKRKHWQSSG